MSSITTADALKVLRECEIPTLYGGYVFASDVARAILERDERIAALEAELAQISADWEKLALPVDGFTGQRVNVFELEGAVRQFYFFAVF